MHLSHNNSYGKPRQQELFGFDWFFHLGDLSPETARSGEQDWRPVSWPHDWSVEYAYNQHAPSGGNLVPNASNKLHVAVSGAGRLLGLDNGDPESKELYTSADRVAFAGMAFAIVQSARSAGEITITITSEGLERATLTVPVR